MTVHDPSVSTRVSAAVAPSSQRIVPSSGASAGTVSTRPRRGESCVQRQLSGGDEPTLPRRGRVRTPRPCWMPMVAGAFCGYDGGAIQVPRAASGLFRRNQRDITDPLGGSVPGARSGCTLHQPAPASVNDRIAARTASRSSGPSIPMTSRSRGTGGESTGAIGDCRGGPIDAESRGRSGRAARLWR